MTLAQYCFVNIETYFHLTYDHRGQLSPRKPDASVNENRLFTERTHLKCRGPAENSSEQTGFVRRNCDLHLWMYPSVFQINLAHSGSDVAEQPAFLTRSPWSTIAKENGRICKRKQPVNRKNTSQMPRTGDKGVNETGFCFVITPYFSTTLAIWERYR